MTEPEIIVLEENKYLILYKGLQEIVITKSSEQDPVTVLKEGYGVESLEEIL